MTDSANNVVDSRLQEALEQYFNGVMLDRTSGDCAILTGVRKQNGAPVDIYAPSFAVARDDKSVAAMAKDFATYQRLAHPRLQAPERLLTGRAFRKLPALALLSCPVPVLDDAFDIRPVEARLQIFAEVLDGLAALHGAGLVHGGLSDRALCREDSAGGVKLTDFTFAGGRKTSVTGQPAAYQSRHVVNTAAPRAEDDVHAAGMLGYRILMGPHGPEAALTGEAAAQDEERLIAAILGEDRPAPEAAALFPEGHPGAAQIARLLARMTGRLANAAPFSSAEAAGRALASVLANPGAATVDTAAPAAPVPAATPAPAPAPAPQGVSRGTALLLFAGFLASTAAAVWFYTEADRLSGQVSAITAAARGMQAEIETERTTLADAAESAEARAAATEAALQALQSVQNDLRAADRALTRADAAGAASAAPAAAEALATAEAALARADAALAESDIDTALEAATQTAEAAEEALAATQAAARSATTARDAARDAAERLATAAGRDGTAPGADALRDEAAAAAEARRLTEAATLWQDASAGYDSAYDTLAGATADARARAEAARDAAAGREDTPAYALATSYMARGGLAQGGGALADAVTLYAAAARSFAVRDTEEAAQ